MPRSAIDKRDAPLEPEVQVLRSAKSPNFAGHARLLRDEGVALQRSGKANWRVASTR